MLDALENYGAIPELPQEGNIVPGVCAAGKHVRNPCARRADNIVLDLRARLSLEFGSKNGVGETDIVAGSVNEGNIRGVQICRTPEATRCEESALPHLTVYCGETRGGGKWGIKPSQRPSIQRNHQNRKSIFFGAFQQGTGDIVVYWPVQLEPSFAVLIRRGHLFNGAGAGRAENVWHVYFLARGSETGLFGFMEQRLDTDGGHEQRMGILLPKQGDGDVAMIHLAVVNAR